MEALPAKPYRYLAAGASLSPLLAAIAAAGRVAADIEADSLHHYREKVCLIQITAGGEDFIVDPLSGLDLTGLLAALAARPIVLHGADYDLRMLKGSFGFVPGGGVFDTMLAAQLLGHEQVGFAALVRRFFGAALSKRGQKADWSHRPLSPAQLEYARCDTHYLEPLARILEGELAKKGRLDWHREACEAAVGAAISAAPQEDPEAWRIKGAGFCQRRELALVRELWHWREAEARTADRPRFKVLGDAPLLALAKWAAAHKGADLSKGPRLPRDFRGRRLRSLAGAIRRANSLPEADWPGRPSPAHPRRRAPDCSAAIERLRGACARIAHELGIAPQVIAPRAAIVAIAQEMGTFLKCGDVSPKNGDVSPRVITQGETSPPLEKRPLIEEIMAAGSLLRWQAELLTPAVQKMREKARRR